MDKQVSQRNGFCSTEVIQQIPREIYETVRRSGEGRFKLCEDSKISQIN
jgi:hypothetical protein